MGGGVHGVRTHKMGKLKGDKLIDSGALRRLHFETQIFEINRREVPGHVPVEGLYIAPGGQSIFFRQHLVDIQVFLEFIVFNLAILKRHDVNVALNAGKDLLPLMAMLLQAGGLVAELFGTFDVRGDEDGTGLESAKVGGELLVHLHHAIVEGVDFMGDVPAFEGVAMTVFFNDFIAEGPVDIAFLLKMAVDPVPARIVRSEIEVHPASLGFGQEQVYQIGVHGENAHGFLQHGGVEGGLLAIPGTDEDDRVDADGFHGVEVGTPVFGRPVLGGDVVGDFVEEGSCDHGEVLRMVVDS